MGDPAPRMSAPFSTPMAACPLNAASRQACRDLPSNNDFHSTDPAWACRAAAASRNNAAMWRVRARGGTLLSITPRLEILCFGRRQLHACVGLCQREGDVERLDIGYCIQTQV